MTTLSTPEPDVDRAFALAVGRAEALLGRPGVAEGDRLRLAASLVGAGVRALARDLLRRKHESAGADASLEREALARAYHAWVGEAPGAPGAQDHLPSPLPVRAAADAFAGAPDAPRVVTGMLDAVLRGLWGIAPEAGTGAVTIRPSLPAHWPFMGLARVRVGRTVLDVDLRRRREALALRVRRAAGPSLAVTLELHPPPSGPTFVDDVELRGPRVRFEAAAEHEVVAYGAST